MPHLRFSRYEITAAFGLIVDLMLFTDAMMLHSEAPTHRYYLESFWSKATPQRDLREIQGATAVALGVMSIALPWWLERRALR